MSKSTNKELIEELQQLNANDRYDQLIANARANRYHDFKQPDDVVCGKMELVAHLSGYPELIHIREAVINGDYDETPDEQDKEEMRVGLPKNMWPLFGL